VKTMQHATRGCRLFAIVAVFSVSGGAPRASLAQVPRTYVLIVTGASGEPKFANEYRTQATALRTAAVQVFGLPDSLITYLSEDPSRDPGVVRGRSTKEGVEQAFENIAARAHRGDQVFILFLGHGSSQGSDSRFNVPGPDLSGADFLGLLGKLSAQQVAFVDASNSSGDLVKQLAGPNRIVITATKSGFEGNETLFGKHFITALASTGADTDKDGRVSLLEAFLYARREVQREYEQSNRLQTEHAMLDDDGDGVGHSDASEKGPDGRAARGFFLGAASDVSPNVANDPRAAQLLATRQELQSRVDSLRALRSGMKEEDFQRALEPLLLKLAETNQALRALESRKP